MNNIINEIVKRSAWAESVKNEKFLQALLDIGTNLDKCYLDQEGNLIIPCSEIQKEEPKPNLGCATTKQIIDELVTRIEIQAPELLNYRTIDGD